MNPRAFRIALSVTAMAVCAGVVAGVAAIPSEAAPPAAPPGDGVAAATDRLAKQLATDARAGLFSAAAAKPVNLAATHGGQALDAAVRRANREVLVAKGLPVNGPSLLQLRLAQPGMRAAVERGDAPLVASAPSDDAAGVVTAYARDGAKVGLDARKAPSRPVFVVEVDTGKALPLGLSVLQRVFGQRGVGDAGPVRSADGYWATQVQSVRLNDDKEPWVKGDAEIFGIAGGFGTDGKAAAATLTMPYLDNDGSTYHPGQLIVHFSAYKYDLADFVMMEDDGDTNYQQLAIAITNALLTIVDGGAYIPLVNAILNAIPASWWTDDPDYVDSWYTLSTTSSGTLNGAAGNGTMTVAPYWVAPV